MAMREEARALTCPGCKAVNHVALEFEAGRDGPRVLECHSCEVQVLAERCAGMHSAPTPEEALFSLRLARVAA